MNELYLKKKNHPFPPLLWFLRRSQRRETLLFTHFPELPNSPRRVRRGAPRWLCVAVTRSGRSLRRASPDVTPHTPPPGLTDDTFPVRRDRLWGETLKLIFFFFS